MTPRFINLKAKKLVGKKLIMSLASNRMAELWKSFMPEKHKIKGPCTNDLISMVIYQTDHFKNFDLSNEFERWATLEVDEFEDIPEGFETFTLPHGLYAVFDYKGSSNDPSVFQFIYGTWLPNSGFVLDNRPHFEVLGEKYKNNDPNSEEEIWIPIRT